MSRASSISSPGSSTESLPLCHPIPPPCSASILRNPLVGSPPNAQPTSTRAKIANTIQNALAGPSKSSPKSELADLHKSPPVTPVQLPSAGQSLPPHQPRRGSIVAQVVSISSPPPPPDHPLHPDNSNHYSHDSDEELQQSEQAQSQEKEEQRPRGRWSRSNSLTEGPASGGMSDRNDEGGRPLASSFSAGTVGSEARGRSPGDGKLKFAPLPPGRRQYRSNSLTLGVAARAKMIQAQGGSPNYSQMRYAGPQQWYQPGAPLPEEVYTYKDVQRGLGKIWRKVSSRGRRDSASSTNSMESATSAPSAASPSTTSARPLSASPVPGASTSSPSQARAPETSANERHAREMESRAKGKHKEIEHIEEVDEDEELDEDPVADDDSQGEIDDLSTRVGFGLGLDVGRVREPSPPPPSAAQHSSMSPSASGVVSEPESMFGSSETEDRDSSSAASVVSSQLMTPDDGPYSALPPSIHQAHAVDEVGGAGTTGIPGREHDGSAGAFTKADKGKGVLRNGDITVG